MVEPFAPRFTTPLHDRLDCLHLTESLGYSTRSAGRTHWQSFFSQPHALALCASWTVTRTLHTAAYGIRSAMRKRHSGAITAAPRVQRAQVPIATLFTRVWSQHTTSYTHDPPTYWQA